MQCQALVCGELGVWALDSKWPFQFSPCEVTKWGWTKAVQATKIFRGSKVLESSVDVAIDEGLDLVWDQGWG